jgi:hypothetical protein
LREVKIGCAIDKPTPSVRESLIRDFTLCDAHEPRFADKMNRISWTLTSKRMEVAEPPFLEPLRRKEG